MKRRLVRAAVGTVAALAVVAASRDARAQAESRQDDVLGGHHHMAQSRQNFAFELRFGDFAAGVDSDPALHGATPYASTFGGGRRLLFSMEFDWQALRIPGLGSLGPALGAGYTKASGLAPFRQPHANPDGTITSISGETTALETYPFYGVAVFRLDVVQQQLHIPLVPYAKFGIGYAIWRASNELGTSNYNGQNGVGGSLGTHLGLGLAFNLNTFDEYSAKNFDEAVGVNNTYAFAEYTRDDLDGLGIQSNPLRVGGEAWTFGIAVEF
jgi:hypothetical protein